MKIVISKSNLGAILKKNKNKIVINQIYYYYYLKQSINN